MTDEPYASDSAAQRPVEPPVIDLRADEFKSHPDNEPAADSAEGPAQENKKRRTLYLDQAPFIISAAVAVVTAGATVALVVWAGWLPRTTSDSELFVQRFAKLESAGNQVQLQVGQLSAVVDDLKRSSKEYAASIAGLQQSISAAAADVKTALSSLDEIRKSLAASEQERSAQSGELSSLREQFSKLQSGLSEVQSKPEIPAATGAPAQSEALASGLISLQTASAEGKPFGAELEGLRKLAPIAEGLDVVSGYAKNGVAGRTALLERLKQFVEDSSKAPEASSAPEGAAALWSTLKKKVSSVVKIRKLGDAVWVEAASKAAKQIEGGDFTGAVKEMQTIEGSPPDRLRQWLEDADQRVKLDLAMETLSAAVMKQISRGT